MKDSPAVSKGDYSARPVQPNYCRHLKRSLEVCLSIPAIALAAPLVSFFALLLWLDHGESPFFLQTRAGKHGIPFRIYKLRTMTSFRNSSGELLPGRLRVTPLGRLVRKWSLDELPQLLNVLRGEMALVGPRPLPVEYLPLYNDLQSHRHDVRPGITGWAQVRGGRALSWKEKLEHDLWYVKHQSLPLDLLIMLLTLKRLIFPPKGEVDPDDAFTGN